MRAAIIGSTKIALIHYRSISQKAYSEIYFISRKISTAKSFIKKNKLDNKVVKPGNYEIINKKKFHLIDVCVNTEFHDKCLNYIKKTNSIIIVEKPIFSLKKIKGNYKDYLDDIYSKFPNLIVCYPMIVLARKFLRYSKSKFESIKKIKVFYKTSGAHYYDYIGQDLLPHALSLIFTIIKKHNFLKNINKINSIVKKNNWSAKIIYKGLSLDFKFIQSKYFKKSKFHFKIDNIIVKRPTKIINDTFINYLIIKGKKIKISNPIDDFINISLRRKKNKNWFKLNKKFTYEMMELNNYLN